MLRSMLLIVLDNCFVRDIVGWKCGTSKDVAELVIAVRMREMDKQGKYTCHSAAAVFRSPRRKHSTQLPP